jgi:glucokinase
LARLLEKYAQARPRAAGVGIPGIADVRTGLVWAPNIRGWDYVPLQRSLSDRAAFPIVVESDRNTAVLGEILYGAARNCSDVVYLIVGTGIGAGIVSGGRLMRGRHDIGGAAGWIPVVFEGAAAHFEQVVAGPAIVRHAVRRQLPGGIQELLDQARSGAPGPAEFFRELGDALGQALAVLVSLLDPEMIVLGGGVSASWDLMESGALQAMRKWAQPEAVKLVQVRVSQLGVRAGILGAAAAARMNEEGQGER